MSGALLRDHSYWGSGDHIWYQGSNLDWMHAKQPPSLLYYLSIKTESLDTFFYWGGALNIPLATRGNWHRVPYSLVSPTPGISFPTGVYTLAGLWGMGRQKEEEYGGNPVQCFFGPEKYQWKGLQRMETTGQ